MSGSGDTTCVTLRIATPDSECAVELVEILRTCGLPSELTRPSGRKVKLVCPDECELEARLADIVRAVEMWLCSPDAPASVEITGGKQTVLVSGPAGPLEAQLGLRPVPP